MGYKLNRINPNQIQVFFQDGRFETLTNEELSYFLAQTGESETSTSEFFQSDLQ